jgi:Flp pilus assembly protein TadB
MRSRMKRLLGELLGLLTGIAGVLFLIGWDDISPLYGVVLVIAFMLLRWIDAWSSGRRRSRQREGSRGPLRS